MAKSDTSVLFVAAAKPEAKQEKLAIVGLSMFGYFERLAAYATSRGVPTEFFDERPSNKVGAKLFFRLAPAAVTRRIGERHISDVCERILSGGFTHVLITVAELIGPGNVQILKDAGLIVSRYTWDSLDNRPSVRRLDRLIDKVGSFDPTDCAQYGYTYIPLYSEVVPDGPNADIRERKIDFYFCGTMHSIRPRIIASMIDVCERRRWKLELKLFYHSIRLYVLRNFYDPVALSLKNRISVVGFPHGETLADCGSSRVVVDIHHPRQDGLTMRTFETLAQGAILLTTNRRALELINPSLHSRIVFLDPQNVEASMESALAAVPGMLDANQRYALSVDRFLDQIFELISITPSLADDARREKA